MKHVNGWKLVLLMLAVYFPLEAGHASEAEAQTRRAGPLPNFLVIVADDMGYTDIAPFGGEIETPNLSRLAERGLRLANFHTAPVCSPTRAMLITGQDNHRVGFGTMAETLLVGVFPQLAEHEGYEGYLSPDIPTLAEALRSRGYQTYMSGKWHLGYTAEQSPHSRGFDRSFALLNGAGNHYGLDQGGAWTETRWVTKYREQGERVRYPVGEYSTDLFTDKMLSYLQNPEQPHRPFFAYIAYTAPHWPLQAPSEIIEKYNGKYDGGWEVLRERRLASAATHGVLPPGFENDMAQVMPSWDALSNDEKQVEARKMEVYAAMIDRMDQNIGRLLKALKDSGQLKNTFIIFFSDNGAAAGGADPGQSGTGPSQDDLGIDNSFSSIGTPSSYVHYGAGWAYAGTGPFRDAKGAVFEGGIRTPAIIAGPGIPAGKVSHSLTHVRDIFPTVLELAHGQPSANVADGAMPWAGLLFGEEPTKRDGSRVTGWEYGFNRAIRDGKWKAVWETPVHQRYGDKTGKSGDWTLFNLAVDPSESRNVAQEHPEVLSRLKHLWSIYSSQNGVVEGIPDSAKGDISFPDNHGKSTSETALQSGSR